MCILFLHDTLDKALVRVKRGSERALLCRKKSRGTASFSSFAKESAKRAGRS
jgi:hypothetical protein